MGPRIALVAGLSAATAGCAAQLESEAPKPNEEATLLVEQTIAETAVPTTVEVTAVPTTTIPETTTSLESTTTTSTTTSSTTSTSTTTSTTTIPETTTTTEYIPTWEDEHLISKEALVQGNKIADLVAVNPDGEVLVNIPMFAVMDLNNREVTIPQLERGAILEVADPDINPDMIGLDNGTPEMSLPGDPGVSISFGHRMTRITPDFDGDQSNGNEGAIQRVYERIDELLPGAVLTLHLTEEAGGKTLTYELHSLRELKNFELDGGGTLAQTAYDLRAGVGIENIDESSSVLSLVACSPKRSTRDRIVADFILVQN